MNEKKGQAALLSLKADAAFRQAAKRVIQRARQTGTPVVVWQDNHVKEIPADQFETTMAATGHRSQGLQESAEERDVFV